MASNRRLVGLELGLVEWALVEWALEPERVLAEERHQQGKRR
jgi:hypothetical protein